MWIVDIQEVSIRLNNYATTIWYEFTSAINTTTTGRQV